MGAALATLCPLAFMLIARADPVWSSFSHHVTARFPWHSVEFGMQSSTLLLFAVTLAGFARGMSRRGQNGVLAALAPVGIWFIIDRLASSEWWVDTATWGLGFAILFSFAALFAGIRERTTTSTSSSVPA